LAPGRFVFPEALGIELSVLDRRRRVLVRERVEGAYVDLDLVAGQERHHALADLVPEFRRELIRVGRRGIVLLELTGVDAPRRIRDANRN
jgi:hypothetical protein